VEGITVDGRGGLRVGAGEEKVRESVLVLRLTFCRHILAFHGGSEWLQKLPSVCVLGSYVGDTTVTVVTSNFRVWSKSETFFFSPPVSEEI
jgi:hypothetical protein